MTEQGAAISSGSVLERAWYQHSLWLYLLMPLACLFRCVVVLRRVLYRLGFLASWRPPVPVVVVGNINVGGTGKTPVVIALVQALQRAGCKPGIVSRGYGGNAVQYPHAVTANDTAVVCGDEPLLIARRTGLPLVVDRNRVTAVQHLLAEYDCDVIVTDDGLQHYALQRDLEIVVVDGARGFANQQLLPVGPLREPLSRLNQIDFLVTNGQSLDVDLPCPQLLMRMKAESFHCLQSGQEVAASQWSDSKRVHAVAGIGNPQRFYQSLRELGLSPIEHSFADHHLFCAENLNFGDDLPVIMTEKDAVKVMAIDYPSQCWYLSVSAEFNDDGVQPIVERVLQLQLAQ